MGAKTEIELLNFFIFHRIRKPLDAEETKKLFYYHPVTDNVETQMKSVGLVEGIIQFTEEFKPSKPVQSLHTSKKRQVFFEAEPDIWFAMTLKIPKISKVVDNGTIIIHDDTQDNVYQAVLSQSYYSYRLFWGGIQKHIAENSVDVMKHNLEPFFNAYLRNLNLSNVDVLNVLAGIQYMPLDKQTFCNVQCFINLLEASYDFIEFSIFLYNDHVIWCGLEPSDMQVVYQYLVNTLLPASVETELRGGSMPRNSSSSILSVPHRGRFLTGPTNLKLAKSIERVPKVYLYSGSTVKEFHLIIYRALSSTVCMFVKGDFELTLDTFKNLDKFINPKLNTLVTDIAEYCNNQVATPSKNVSETDPKFIYFNKLNLAYKSTLSATAEHHTETLGIMADMCQNKHFLGPSGETIVKTMNEYWVVCRTSNSRELYIVLQQKNATLFEISEEVKKLCDNELKSIFF